MNSVWYPVTVFYNGSNPAVAGDIDEEHLARLRTRFHHRSNLRVCHCDLTKPEDFRPFLESMDSVVCLNVLEHVEDDLLGLRNVHSALKPGGRAIILVPHGQEVFGSLDVALGQVKPSALFCSSAVITSSCLAAGSLANASLWALRQ